MNNTAQNKTVAIAAQVSAKTRFNNDRRELTVLISPTELGVEYWGDHLAKDKVRSELYALGLKSYFWIQKWITEDHQVIEDEIHL